MGADTFCPMDGLVEKPHPPAGGGLLGLDQRCTKAKGLNNQATTAASPDAILRFAPDMAYSSLPACSPARWRHGVRLRSLGVPISHDAIFSQAKEFNLEDMTRTCPSGWTTQTLIKTGKWADRHGKKHQRWAFLFDAEVCYTCARRSDCVRGQGRKGRSIQLHPQERLLQEAREFQESAAFKEYGQTRQAAEHRLARLVQLGIRQAPHFGRRKTLFQLLMALPWRI